MSTNSSSHKKGDIFYDSTFGLGYIKDIDESTETDLLYKIKYLVLDGDYWMSANELILRKRLLERVSSGDYKETFCR